MKVLLITPPYHSGIVESAGKWPPLHLLYIAGALDRNKYEVIVYDAMSKDHTFEQITQRIEEVDPDVVGMGAYTPTINSCLETLTIAKKIKKSTITVLGGVHPTFCYNQLLQEHTDNVDFIVVGEGELTFRELVEAISANGYGSKDRKHFKNIPGIAFYDYDSGKPVFTGKRAFIDNLDILTPAWDLLEWNDYPFYVLPEGRLATISTSRGCIYSCTFCSQTKLWEESWRACSPEMVIQHVDVLKNKFSRNTFLIADEYPTKDAGRWEKILDLLIESSLDCHFLMETRAEDIVRDEKILWKYRKAGIIHIFVGVETTDQKTLNHYKKEMTVAQSEKAIKLINSHGIISETSIIVGLPQETKLSIKQKLRDVKRLAPDFAHFLNIMPWPYTDIYNELKPFIIEKDYSKYNYANSVVLPPAFSNGEVTKEILKCYMDFYMWQLKRWVNEKDEFKKDYLFRALKEITERSFLHKEKTGLDVMPATVLETLKSLGIC